VPTSSAVTIHVLTPAQVPAALRLSNEAGWNQREEDWRAAIGMTPGASFCAMAESVLVATCIGISYVEFSWIAMMLVDPAFQRQGLGASLLLGAIKALPSDRPVGLDATAVGRLLYEQHGFRDTCKLTRWIADDASFDELEADPDNPRSVATIRPIAPNDLTEIASADRRVFGGDRRRVLEWALSAGPACCAIAIDDTELSGYVFGRSGRVFNHLGAVVARSGPIARALVRHVAKSAPRPIGIDAFDADSDWNGWLEASGFVRQRPLARMMRPAVVEESKGRRVERSQSKKTIRAADAEEQLRAFSIFGPEFA
jgi:predicted N-acetyltransferase YhbS